MPKKYSGKPKNTKEALERIGGGLAGARAIPGSHRGNFAKGLTAEENKLMDKALAGAELTPEQYAKLDKVAAEQMGQLDDYITANEKRANINLKAGMAATFLLQPNTFGPDDTDVKGKKPYDFSKYQEPADKMQDKEKYLFERSGSPISIWDVGEKPEQGFKEFMTQALPSGWDKERLQREIRENGEEATFEKVQRSLEIDKYNEINTERDLRMMEEASPSLRSGPRRKLASDVPTGDGESPEFIRRYPYNSKRSKK